MSKVYKKDRVFDNIIYAVIFLLIIVICLPLIHIVFASVSNPEWVRNYKGLILFPHEVTFNGYSIVFQNSSIFRSLLNSLFYMVCGTAINMLLTIIGAYVLSKKQLMLNKFFMIIITVTMFFGGGLIPLFMLLRDLNFLDTVWAILIPTAISPWNLIILRTAFQSLPDSIIDAARMDGAGQIKILTDISLPLIKATTAIITMYYAIEHWNSWFAAMAFLRNRDLYPLQLILREILVVNDTSQIIPGGMGSMDIKNASVLVQYCSVVVSVLPIMIIFPFVQKNFTTGVLVGSIKS